MKHWLSEKLICPDCLPAELPLELSCQKEASGDILEGELNCRHCGAHFPINRGVADLTPQKVHQTEGDKSGGNGYNAPLMLSAYLWSHFGDLLHDGRATDAYRLWSERFRPAAADTAGGDALDIGCAVGRLCFEMSDAYERVIGVDTSPAFIAKAREIAERKALDFDLIVEGHLTRRQHLEFNNHWRFENVEFIVADALALPFRKRDFASIAAINVLEKVPDPLKHLREVNRVLAERDSLFLFSDPFSWDPAFSKPERWLGGSSNGTPYSRRGIDTMRRLFAGEFGVFDPPLRIADEGDVSWKIRKTENLWEHITSQFLVGCRKETLPKEHQF